MGQEDNNTLSIDKVSIPLTRRPRPTRSSTFCPVCRCSLHPSHFQLKYHLTISWSLLLRTAVVFILRGNRSVLLSTIITVTITSHTDTQTDTMRQTVIRIFHFPKPHLGCFTFACLLACSLHILAYNQTKPHKNESGIKRHAVTIAQKPEEERSPRKFRNARRAHTQHTTLSHITDTTQVG